MTKLSREDVWKRKLELFVLKWEFLRRNSSFSKLFKDIENYSKSCSLDLTKFFAIANKTYPSPKLSDETLAYVKKTCISFEKNNHFYKLYRQLCQDWEMLALLPPEYDVWTFSNEIFNFDTLTFKGRKHHCLLAFIFMRMFEVTANSLMETNAPFPVNIKIDPKLDFPLPEYLQSVLINFNHSKSAILDSISLLYDMKKQNIDQTRVHIEKYVGYLRVYELRESGKDFMDIALDMYPLESKTTGASMEDNIRRRYNACLSLINGGYRQIR